MNSSADEHISRMAAAGVLSPDQAADLLRVVNPAGAVKGCPHRSLPVGLLAGAVLTIAGVVALFALASGDGSSVATIQDVNQTINTMEGVGVMNRGLSNAISFVLFGLPVVVGLLYFVSVYNGIVRHEEGVYNAWADVESTYKRRADLVPNLVGLVESYMKHERETLTDVTDQRNDMGEALKTLVARQQAASEALAGTAPENETALASLDQSQSLLMQSLRGVVATAEAYPGLRSADQFLALQAELEGTENRINIARIRFNEEVRGFNEATRRLPGSLVAGIGNFQRKAYFTTATSDEQPVQVRIGGHSAE